MRSIAKFDLQYAHRFYNFKGEAQYLHGHTGKLTIEVEDTINRGVNMVFPCNEIQKTAWDVLKNFDHALILRHDDPLLPAILNVYQCQGIRCGHPQNTMKGEAFETDLAKAYPDCRLVVTKETMTVEGMIKIVYDLLKDKLNIAKLTFTSGANAASEDFTISKSIDRCPWCGIAMNKDGVCPKCGYYPGKEDADCKKNKYCTENKEDDCSGNNFCTDNKEDDCLNVISCAEDKEASCLKNDCCTEKDESGKQKPKL